MDMFDSDGNYTGTDQRRIAGGQQTNGLASVILTPFKNTILKVGAGYSASSFDTQWAPNQAQSTIAYAVEATQLLTPKTLISTSVNNTSTNRAHTVKISRILPGNIEGNITGQYNVSHVDGIESNANVTAGLSYPAPKTYSNMFAGGIGDLKSWVQQPVIYNARVLAIAEEKILTAGISLKGQIPTSPMPVNDNFQQLYTIKTDEFFSYDKQVYSSMVYTIKTYQADGKTPATLNLQMSPLDNYNYTITSSAPMPINALVNGETTKYMAVITAEGKRGGQTVTTVNSSPFEVDVTQNSKMPSANWTGNTALTSTSPSATNYKSGSLDTYVKGLDGETFTYTVVEGSQQPAPTDPSYKLKISDGKYVTADKIPNTFTGASVKITAISQASNNSVVIPNTKQTEQTFTIALNKNLVLPKATGVAPPGAIQGLDYPETTLNPYLNNALYLTQTSNGQKSVDDILDFTLSPKGDGNDCGDWLSFEKQNPGQYGNPGIIYNSKPVPAPVPGKTSCNLTFSVHSNLANADTTITLPVSLRTPDYKQPTWVPNKNLPNVNSNSPYMLKLNPYNTTETSDGAYLTKTFNTDSGQDIEAPAEELTGFSASSISCSGNVNAKDSFVITDDGLLKSQGNLPSSANGTCTVKPVFNSKVLGKTISNTPSASFTINDSTPQWVSNSPLTEIPYTGSNGTYLVPVRSNLQPGSQDATLKDPVTIASLPGGGGAKPIYSDDKQTNIMITNSVPSADEVAPKGSTYPGSTGSFSIKASKNGVDNIKDAVFSYRIYGTFTPPDVKANLAPSSIGQKDYKLNINPYPSESYMSKTLLTYSVNGTPETLSVSDPDLSFDKGDNSGNGACQWATISSDGTITQLDGKTPNGQNCTFNFTIKSSKTGGTAIKRSATIPTTSAAPVWSKDASGTIKFDTTAISECNANTQCITLDDKINPEARTPGLVFTTTAANWTVKKDSTNGLSYLMRNPTADGIDALDAMSSKDKPIPVPVTASNELATNVPGTVQVSVLPDPTNVLVSWTGDKALKAQGTVDQSIDLTSHFISTVANGPIKGKTIIDKLYMGTGSNGNVTQTPGGWISVNGSEGNYSVVVPAAVLANPEAYGVYPNTLASGSNQLKLPGFYTASMGAPDSQNPDRDLTKDGVTLTVSGQLAWNTNSTQTQTIYFDAIKEVDSKYGPGKCTNCGINLNQLLKSNPVAAKMTDVVFTVVDDTTNWEITPDGYLLRKALQGNGRKTLNGAIVDAPSPSVQISVTAKDMLPSETLTLLVKIVPDDRAVNSSPLFFGWDTKAANGTGLTVKVGERLGFVNLGGKAVKLTGTYSDDSLIKLCVTTCDTVVTNVIIQLPVYSGSTDNTKGELPLQLSPTTVCSERIDTKGSNMNDNLGAVINYRSADGSVSGNNDSDAKDSYLGLALGNRGDCNIVTNSYYTLVDADAGKAYRLTFSQVRLDPGTSKVWANMDTKEKGMQVSSPPSWLFIAPKNS